jgi:uncharacterized protein YecE (DUF72 family)
MTDRSVTARSSSADFSERFDRAVAACARSQQLVGRSAQALFRACRSRASRMTSPGLRRIAIEVRDAWAAADAIHGVLRAEVTRIACSLRDAGVDDRAAAASVRLHIRFVLYDHGLTEEETEPVVQRASVWVEQVYAP